MSLHVLAYNLAGDEDTGDDRPDGGHGGGVRPSSCVFFTLLSNDPAFIGKIPKLREANLKPVKKRITPKIVLIREYQTSTKNFPRFYTPWVGNRRSLNFPERLLKM